MEKYYELYSCSENQVFLQRCMDSKCRKCGPVKVNPYGYVPDVCQEDYLKVVCSNTPQHQTQTHLTVGSGHGIEGAAKKKLASIGERPSFDEMEAQETEVKAKQKMKTEPATTSAEAVEAENTAKEKVQKMRHAGVEEKVSNENDDDDDDGSGGSPLDIEREAKKIDMEENGEEEEEEQGEEQGEEQEEEQEEEGGYRAPIFRDEYGIKPEVDDDL